VPVVAGIDRGAGCNDRDRFGVEVDVLPDQLAGFAVLALQLPIRPIDEVRDFRGVFRIGGQRPVFFRVSQGLLGQGGLLVGLSGVFIGGRQGLAGLLVQ